MRIVYIFRLVLAFLLLWPTIGLADEHEGGGHHNSKNCDTSPVKYPFHDTALLINDICVLENPLMPGYQLVWTCPDVTGFSQLYPNEPSFSVSCADVPTSEDSVKMLINSSTFQVPSSYVGTFSYYLKSNSECPDRDGDTITIHFIKDCNPSQVKYAFKDTTLYIGDICCLPSPMFIDYTVKWHTPFDSENITPEEFASHEEGWAISCSGGDNPAELTMGLWETFYQTISTGDTGFFSYEVLSQISKCPDRKGDTIRLRFAIVCDSTPVKLPFHDTIFCEGDSLLLVATDQPHRAFNTLWSNLSTMEEWIHEGDSFYITEAGTYTFQLYNLLHDGCPDREGDTVNVAFHPKPQAFLPKDTLQTCSGHSGALLLESEQPSIDFLWSDGDTSSSYRFFFLGDTLDKRFCTLSNICGDTVVDSVIVRFLPPYVYLGNDSLMGCRGDSVLFDLEPYNSHLPNYDSMRFVWQLRGETILDGRPADHTDPARLWVHFPQDSGLLTVQVFYPDPDHDADSEKPTSCPITSDTIKLIFYIWPDIDFFVRNGDTTICYYDSVELFLDRDSLVFSPDAYYIWLFDSVPYDTTADKVFYAADTGLYTVTGVNYCSRHSESFFLHHYPKARITVELQDTTVCPETPVSLDPTLPYGGNRYVWFKGESDNDYEDWEEEDDDGGNYMGNLMEFRNPGESPEDEDMDTWPWEASAALWVDTPGTYILYVQDSIGCMTRNEMTITAEECLPQFEIPNVFTPNGDGINDVLKLTAMVKLFDFEIRLFNRWGNQVYAYKGEPEEFSWDGTLHGNGQGAPDGVYFYVATYKDYLDKKKKQSGSVTILR